MKSNFKTALNKILSIIILLMMLSACNSSTATSTPAVSSSPAQTVLNKDVFDTKKYEGQLRVYFFDFNIPGQVPVKGSESDDKAEDCTLIITPDGKTMLIDAGRQSVGKKVIEYLDKLGVKKIDVAVATHRHGDHVGGYPEVISKKEIGRFISSRLLPASSVTNALAAKKIEFETPDDGYKFKLGNDVEFEVLIDNNELEKAAGLKEGESTSFINNKSMVLKLTYKNNSFLFAGDIQNVRERDLVLNRREDINCDVIKVPHHGYNTSSTDSFIKAVSPKYAVVETYAITTPSVLIRYEVNKAKVYMTADNGNILITSDGNNLTVIEEKKVEKRKLY